MFCHVLEEEVDCSGIIMKHLEVEEFVSLLAGILEKKTLGLQHVLDSGSVVAQVMGAKYTVQNQSRTRPGDCAAPIK